MNGGVYIKNDKTGVSYKISGQQAKDHTLALQDLLMSEAVFQRRKPRTFYRTWD